MMLSSKSKSYIMICIRRFRGVSADLKRQESKGLMYDIEEEIFEMKVYGRQIVKIRQREYGAINEYRENNSNARRWAWEMEKQQQEKICFEGRTDGRRGIDLQKKHWKAGRIRLSEEDTRYSQIYRGNFFELGTYKYDDMRSIQRRLE